MTYPKSCAGPRPADHRPAGPHPCTPLHCLFLLTLILSSPAQAHSGHLELSGFYVEQRGERSYLYGQIRYPANDGRLELQAASSQNYTATLENEKNGRWLKVLEIALEGNLALDRDSDYRLALPANFDFAAFKGRKIPFSFLFGAGGAQVLEVPVGAPVPETPLWLLGVSGLVFGFVARWAWQHRARRRRRWGLHRE